MHPEIFSQAFVARLLPSAHEVLLPAIRNFHFGQYPLNAALAALGALTASVVLYFLGVLLRRWPERGLNTDEKRAQMVSVRAKAQSIIPWLLVFAPLPVGGMIIIAAGFFRLRPLQVALILAVAEIIYRAMPYMHS